MSMAERFGRLPTGAKLLLILTAVLLPIGIGLALIGNSGIHQANEALEGRKQDQSRAAAGAIESLIARNALALRVAANGALASGPAGACDRMQRSLSIAPAVAQSFEVETPDGEPICAIGNTGDIEDPPALAPGNIRVRISPGNDGLTIRVGVINGMSVEPRRVSGFAPKLNGAGRIDSGLPVCSRIGPNEPMPKFSTATKTPRAVENFGMTYILRRLRR